MPRPKPSKDVNMLKLAKTLELAWREVNWPMFRIQSWNHRFTKEVTKNYKVSLCTTCMNRLENLKITLPENIKSNPYPNVEFVVLDYNGSDDVGAWIKAEMMEHIESGKLMFLRIKTPQCFDMSHSRNVAFLAATGDIVNNLDADTFAKNNFAEFINKLANEQPEKAIFAKSRQLLRGRLGFFKSDFISLGGYSETLTGYGHDDSDLLHRAWSSSFKLMPFSRSGDFEGKIPDHHKHQGQNYRELWWITEARNRFISYSNLILKKYKANENIIWGKAKLIKNFKEEINTGIQG